MSPRFHLFSNFLYWRVDLFQVLSKINYNKTFQVPIIYLYEPTMENFIQYSNFSTLFAL